MFGCPPDFCNTFSYMDGLTERINASDHYIITGRWLIPWQFGKRQIIANKMKLAEGSGFPKCPNHIDAAFTINYTYFVLKV